MWRKVLLLSVVTTSVSCSYEPAFDIACEAEGAALDGRTCRGGVWVADVGAADRDDGGLNNGANNANNGLNNGGDDVGELDMSHEMGACVPETDQAFCTRLGYTCGQATGVDNCGAMRTVATTCGSCTAPALCGGGGTDFVCACGDETDTAFCSRFGKTCDVFTEIDVCGLDRTVNCGMACPGLESCSDNLCVCDEAAACAMLGKTCGEVDVQGMCGLSDDVDCGTCGSNASCSDDNVCMCDDGYAGVNCLDIDECAMSADDCDANATCTNLPGTFSCACNNGYTGDGKTCAPVPSKSPALSVQTIKITLSDGDGSDTVSLPNALTDPGQAVPFATARLAATGDELDRLSFDVSIASNGDVVVSREDSTGGAVFVVTVVEFDPAEATVQKGTWSFTNTSAMVNISQVPPGEGFVVFYGTNDSSSDRKDALFVTADINAQGNRILFARDNNTGTVSGHWWVVKSVAQSFSVQHLDGQMAQGTASLDIAMTSVPGDKTLLLYSHSAGRGDNDSDANTVGCKIQSTTLVRCQRYSNVDGIPLINAQVVTWKGTPKVYRNDSSFPSNDGQNLEAIGAQVGATSMAFGGRLGVAGITRVDTTNGSDSEAGYFTHEIVNNGANIELRRGETAAAATVNWQVIDW